MHRVGFRLGAVDSCDCEHAHHRKFIVRVRWGKELMPVRKRIPDDHNMRTIDGIVSAERIWDPLFLQAERK